MLLLLSSTAAAACSSITQQNINQGPYVIATSGSYCITEDIHVDYNWRIRNGPTVIDIRTRDVNIYLNEHSIINDDGSNYIKGIYSNGLQAFNARGRQTGVPFSGTEFTISDGKIIGFDFGILDVALRRTQKFLVENVDFENVYQAIIARPVKAIVKNNQFVNTEKFSSSTVGVSLQQTDEQIIEDNSFLNHHTSMDIFGSKSVEVRRNKIASPGVKFPVYPRGVTITDVSDANVYDNQLISLYIGVLFNLRTSGSIINNEGCDLTYPTLINPPAVAGEMGNNWNSC